MLDQWATLTPRPMPQPAACAPHRVRRCHVIATRTLCAPGFRKFLKFCENS